MTDTYRRLRVVEYAQDSIAASFAARLMADLGADVVKVEAIDRPDPLRERPPIVDGVSVPFAYTSTGKRIERLRGGARFEAELRGLVEDADVLLLGGMVPAPPTRARGVTIAISPFGQRGPRSSWRAGAASLFHAGGVGYLTPRAAQTGVAGEVVPEAPGGYLTEYFCGLYAAIGGFAFGAAGGRRFVDLSMQDCLLPLTRREVGAWLTSGVVPSRRERLWQVGPSDFYPAADGYVYVSVIEDAQWKRLVELTGWADPVPEQLATAHGRFTHADVVDTIIGPWLSARTRAEIFEQAGRAGIPIGPAFSAQDLAAQDVLWRSGVLRRIEYAGVRLTLPSPPPAPPRSVSSAERMPWRGEAPQPGSGPLAGIRVIEFAHVWAGPLCGQYLADLGAQVIRVESRRYLDVHRRAGPYVGGVADINGSTVWRAQNRGKLGCTIDLKSEEGRDLALRLVAAADLVIENYRPGTMERLGLGYRQLRAVAPDISLVSLSGYGQQGERSQFPAYGPMMDAVAGLAWCTRDGTGRPHSVNGWFPDVAGALYGALHATARVRGAVPPGHADVSELQSLLSLLPEMVASAHEPGHRDRLRANMGFGRDCLPIACRGEDSWIVVELDRKDQTLSRVREVLAGRVPRPQSHDDTRDVRELAREVDAEELAAALQRAGVVAVPVLSARDLVSDEHLNVRRSYLGGNPPTAEMTMYAPVWLTDGARSPAGRTAPELGRDNAFVFGSLLSLSDAEIDRLTKAGIIG